MALLAAALHRRGTPRARQIRSPLFADRTTLLPCGARSRRAVDESG